MIKKTDIFGYFMTKEHNEFSCPLCNQESLVNLNNNDKLVCVNPECDWEWNRH